jgi:hypothetical protein
MVFGIAMVLGAALVAVPTTERLVLTFEDTAVVASGIAPGGQAVWFGIAYDFQRVRPELLRWERVDSDADGDGRVTLQVGRPIPVRSLWIAVDLTTGDYAIATPNPASKHERPQDARALVNGAKGTPQFFREQRAYLDVLLVRPGVGCWTVSLGDGGVTDSDGRPDGFVKADFSRMVPLGTSPASPEDGKGKDLVFAVDPETLQFSVSKLGDK